MLALQATAPALCIRIAACPGCDTAAPLPHCLVVLSRLTHSRGRLPVTARGAFLPYSSTGEGALKQQERSPAGTKHSDSQLAEVKTLFGFVEIPQVRNKASQSTGAPLCPASSWREDSPTAGSKKASRCWGTVTDAEPAPKSVSSLQLLQAPVSAWPKDSDFEHYIQGCQCSLPGPAAFCSYTPTN